MAGRCNSIESVASEAIARKLASSALRQPQIDAVDSREN